MASTRRQFIKQFGVLLASLIATRCAPAARTPGPMLPMRGSGSPRDDLRNSWLRLDWLTQQMQEDYQRGDRARDELIADHHAILDELIAAGELDANVADQVQVAFAAAAYHAWFSGYLRYNICYTPTPSPMPGYTPEPYEVPGYALADYIHTSAYQLVQQANLLTEMAEDGDLAPDTVAQAQAAIERDISFLNIVNKETQAGLEQVIAPSHLSNEETWALYNALGAAVSDPHNLPSFDSLDLEIAPEAAEAARFLVDLLLEKTK